jgi:hypothetical protein
VLDEDGAIGPFPVSYNAPGQLPVTPLRQANGSMTGKTVAPRLVWRFNHKIRLLPAGKILRIETLTPAVIHWSADDWQTVQDVTTHDVGLGIHIADLTTKAVPEGKQVKFTFYWPDADHWEGADFIVRVGSFHWDGTASAERS